MDPNAARFPFPLPRAILSEQKAKVKAITPALCLPDAFKLILA
jgi:hypothetical protein